MARRHVEIIRTRGCVDGTSILFVYYLFHSIFNSWGRKFEVFVVEEVLVRIFTIDHVNGVILQTPQHDSWPSGAIYCEAELHVEPNAVKIPFLLFYCIESPLIFPSHHTGLLH